MFCHPTSPSPDLVVDDTAARPNIGFATLVASLSKDQLPSEIMVSDTIAMMVSVCQITLGNGRLGGVSVGQFA